MITDYANLTFAGIVFCEKFNHRDELHNAYSDNLGENQRKTVERQFRVAKTPRAGLTNNSSRMQGAAHFQLGEYFIKDILKYKQLFLSPVL